MSPPIIGDKLYWIVNATWLSFFKLGENIQLSYSAFSDAATSIEKRTEETIILKYPIGQQASGDPMMGENKYDKKVLIARYSHLSKSELPLIGIYSLVTGMEAMLVDVVRTLILAYPKKLEGKRTMPLSKVLSCETLESVHAAAADSLINELAYKSPREFAESIVPIISFNLLEIPVFHRYIEVKATRDIYIHNRGVANDIYVTKADSHARVSSGKALPVNIQYFMGAYESCIQLAESFKKELHQHWPSPLFEIELNSDDENKTQKVQGEILSHLLSLPPKP